MRRYHLGLLLLSALLLGAVIAACGDDDDDDDDAATATATATAADDGDDALADLGRTLAAGQGCTGCHTTDGSTGVGPTWLGLFGKTETLDDGSTVEVDADYIIESIREPDAKVVEGFFAGIMPPYASLTDEQIESLVSYIQTLEE
jgi:cytochrome c oxidase subunit 2